MPAIKNVVETFDKLKELHRKKNDDYSGSFGPFFNFEFCEYVANLFLHARDKVYATFIAVKLGRLAVTLSASKVNNESIEDSFDDLITYAALWKADFVRRSEIGHGHISDQYTVRESPDKSFDPIDTF